MCGATQYRWVMVECSVKHGPLEKGMANHFNILPSECREQYEKPKR